MTYLAVPIAAKDIGQAALQINAAHSAGAEMLELRTDYLANLNTGRLKALLGCAKATNLPIIVTCRDKAQGGIGNWDPALRTEILLTAINGGANYVDCEYDNFIAGDTGRLIEQALAENPQVRLILSAHNFTGPFDDLNDLYSRISQACPQAIPKLAYNALHINDCFGAFDLLHSKTGDAIVLCMGQGGVISRILAKKLDGLVTFACTDDCNATAPGQITLAQYKTLYRWDKIDGRTKLFGVIGNPIDHSLSPAIFNANFQIQDSNELYLPILLQGQEAEFNAFLENVISRPWLDFGGFSVTIPHKAHALNYVNHAGEFVESLAEDIGAVNTLKIGSNGRIKGYNTDYAGAMNALTDALGIDTHGLGNIDAAVIGAGGVARAVVAGLTNAKAKVTIYNRTVEKARGLASEFACKSAGLDELDKINAKVLINCTSIGMEPDVNASPVMQDIIKSDMVVFDTVYTPADTLLLKLAAQAGAKTISGREMFIRQAMAQYKIYTGRQADESTIRKTLAKNI